MTLFRPLIAVLLLSVSAGLWACDDDAKTADDTTAADTTAADTTAEDTTAEDTTAEDTTAEDTTGGTLPPSDLSVSSCSETPSQTDCIKHADCEASDRCEDVSNSDLEVPCCVPGPRGTDPPGTLCDAGYLCDTGFCVARNDDPAYCSNTCTDDGDCAAPISECVYLFLEDDWCVTPSAE